MLHAIILITYSYLTVLYAPHLVLSMGHSVMERKGFSSMAFCFTEVTTGFSFQPSKLLKPET